MLFYFTLFFVFDYKHNYVTLFNHSINDKNLENNINKRQLYSKTLILNKKDF